MIEKDFLNSLVYQTKRINAFTNTIRKIISPKNKEVDELLYNLHLEIDVLEKRLKDLINK